MGCSRGVVRGTPVAMGQASSLDLGLGLGLDKLGGGCCAPMEVPSPPPPRALGPAAGSARSSCECLLLRGSPARSRAQASRMPRNARPAADPTTRHPRTPRPPTHPRTTPWRRSPSRRQASAPRLYPACSASECPSLVPRAVPAPTHACPAELPGTRHPAPSGGARPRKRPPSIPQSPPFSATPSFRRRLASVDEAERVEDILMFGGGPPPRPPAPRPTASAPLPATLRAARRSSARRRRPHQPPGRGGRLGFSPAPRTRLHHSSRAALLTAGPAGSRCTSRWCTPPTTPSASSSSTAQTCAPRAPRAPALCAARPASRWVHAGAGALTPLERGDAAAP